MNTNIRMHRKRRQKQARELGETKRRYTQQEIADALGLPRSRISMIESGQALPTLAEVEAIAKILDLTVGHLVTAKQLDYLMEL